MMMEVVSNGDTQQPHQPERMVSGESSGEEYEARVPKKRERAETWVHEETRCLLSLRREMDFLFNTSKSNKHLWEKISAKMREKGFNRSPAMCTDKWRNLFKEFKTAKHQDWRKGSVKMFYYKEIEKILKERNQNFQNKTPTSGKVGMSWKKHTQEKGIVKKFNKDGQEEKFRNVTSKRSIVDGTVVNFEVLNGMPVFKWLNDVGLDKYCTVDEPIYPELVKYFYNNWIEVKHANDDGVDCYTFVNGVEISIDENMILDALNFEDEEERTVHDNAQFWAVSKGETIGEWEYPACFEKFAVSKKVGKLNPYVRVLHKIVVECLVPRGGNETSMTVTDACILWHILTKRRIDMSYLILNHMRHIAGSGRNKGLSFGMIITKILKAYAVPLCEEVCQMPEVLTSSRLAYMKMHYQPHHKQWVTTKPDERPLNDFPLLPGGRVPMNQDDPLSTPFIEVLLHEAIASTATDEDSDDSDDDEMPEGPDDRPATVEDSDGSDDDEMPEGPDDRPATYGDVKLLHKKFSKRMKRIEQLLKVVVKK